MADGNCDVWGYVDFGEGTVKVRCTLPGVHTHHACVVQIEEDSKAEENKPDEARHNVFES